MDGYNVPVAGISLDGAMYMAVKTNYTPGQQTSITLLTRYDEETQHFTVLRELSRMPNGRFITLTMREAPPGLNGLPADHRYVLVFGTGEYRRSDAYLMAVPADSFETGEGTLLRYAPQPWGSWSAPQVVWDPRRDAGYGSFIYDPNRSDNAHLAGPIIPADRDPMRLFGGFYAPYIIERLTQSRRQVRHVRVRTVDLEPLCSGANAFDASGCFLNS